MQRDSERRPQTRTILPPIRRALELRDQAAASPAVLHGAATHTTSYWADGGETELSNRVLLYRMHHRLLHRTPAPPLLGLHAAREPVEAAGDAGVLITGEESMPAWDGLPMDLGYGRNVFASRPT